ncbi:MAG: cell division protein SepF [Promethearchaeota archaeon]
MGLWSKKSTIEDVNLTGGVDNSASVNGGMNTMFFSNQLKQRTMFIKKMSLGSMADIGEIQGEISDGNLTIIDVADFVTSGEFTVLELKRAIEQIRGTCKKLGGMLARLGERYLLATPNENLRF